MKYRIQLEAVFNNTDANNILNQVESIKNNIYIAEESTIVPIIQKAQILEPFDLYETPIIYDYVDFNASLINHNSQPLEVTDFKVEIDISFIDLNDCNDFLNYLETIKINSLSEYYRRCRFFECRHEEIPLTKDGNYNYIDFTGEIIEH